MNAIRHAALVLLEAVLIFAMIPSGQRSYERLYRHVEAGGTGTLYVGVDPAPADGGMFTKVDSLPGLVGGVYDCRLLNGKVVLYRHLY